MKVFLLSDVPNLGKKNSLIEVKDGYAKNFLIKKNLALAYQGINRTKIDQLLARTNASKEGFILQAKLLKSEIEKTPLKLYLKTREGRVFGRISHHDIIERLAIKKIQLSKHAFNDHKTFGLGLHQIRLHLAKDVDAILSLEIKPKE